ncbi:MAG: peptidase M22 [Clostridia bacterium]|nr:peptidase M22 [Clostridia bacterium]
MAETEKKTVLLGIDTSNYTTSAALSIPDPGHASGGFVIKQVKKLLTVKDGQKGLRQSDAVFAHTVNLPGLMEELFSGLDFIPEIAGIGYSARPRPIDGSYMPCFLVGETVARSMAAALRVPLFPLSHQEGHIAAAAYSAMEDSGSSLLAEVPFLAFHVSGGTTDLLYVTHKGTTYDIKPLGCSVDLHAGQAIDRTGVMLGLSFPCGPALEKLASVNTVKIPSPKICVRGCDCNLSGLENLTKKMLDDGAAPEAIAAYTFAFIGKTLETMTKNALELYPGAPVLFAGGVMSNKLMRGKLSALCKTCGTAAFFAEPAFSADNAAGISLLAARAFAVRTFAARTFAAQTEENPS